ncbi:ATP-binding protein [Agathobacter rectalis]|uniref:ATP-binding protein n=1 Tax=Agathobacter rectalis TaxID=39491 RepID=UPI003ED9EB1F
METKEITIEPKVDSAQEFIEIALDFSNPLDLVREAISNAFDAEADNIVLEFSVIQEYGEKVLKIEIEDNGTGMDEKGLASFFDLGNSLRRGDENSIGEKGHGTKVFFNSRKIEVITVKDEKKYHAVMNEPSRELFERRIPKVKVTIDDDETVSSGTSICIWGYNNNRRDKFTHDQLKDYILWFTKFGSIEREFGIEKNSNVKLKFKGIDRRDFEELEYGHVFPKESKKVSDLFDKYIVEAPKWYCKKFIKTGSLKNMPEIEYHAIFVIEGTKVKYGYNPMIRRSGYNAPAGAYTIQERYGLWLCKDFMPIQRKNEWITTKGSEYTKFHAFINCQDLRLTANRGSIENTPSEVLQDLMDVVKEMYINITQSADWMDIEWLESEVTAYNTAEKERKDFEWRIDKVNRAKVADFNGIHLIEPQRESGVFTIFMQLSSYDSGLFPFTIIDYDTHSGIDVIVKAKDDIPIKSSKLYYVEFKNYLTKDFNHSFENLHSIICWDINLKDLKNNDEVIDIANQRRTLKIIQPEHEGDYTRYYLDSMRSGRKIEVFVLKYYLKEKLGIEFVPRTEKSTI